MRFGVFSSFRREINYSLKIRESHAESVRLGNYEHLCLDRTVSTFIASI